MLGKKRYSRAGKLKKLPAWIGSHLRSEFTDLSTEMAVEIATDFVKKMAQPHGKKDELGISLLSEEHLKEMLRESRIRGGFERRRGEEEDGGEHKHREEEEEEEELMEMGEVDDEDVEMTESRSVKRQMGEPMDVDE